MNHQEEKDQRAARARTPEHPTAAVLANCGVGLSCPRCTATERFGQPSVELAGEAVISMQDGSAIPVAVLICTKCGYVAQHALGPLGLLRGVAFSQPR